VLAACQRATCATAKKGVQEVINTRSPSAKMRWVIDRARHGATHFWSGGPVSCSARARRSPASCSSCGNDSGETKSSATLMQLRRLRTWRSVCHRFMPELGYVRACATGSIILHSDDASV